MEVERLKSIELTEKSLVEFAKRVTDNYHWLTLSSEFDWKLFKMLNGYKLFYEEYTMLESLFQPLGLPDERIPNNSIRRVMAETGKFAEKGDSSDSSVTIDKFLQALRSVNETSDGLQMEDYILIFGDREFIFSTETLQYLFDELDPEKSGRIYISEIKAMFPEGTEQLDLYCKEFLADQAYSIDTRQFVEMVRHLVGVQEKVESVEEEAAGGREYPVPRASFTVD